ncbi:MULTISPECIES: 3D domain-containing protein [Enterococcus]|uniref:3D domain-containing protein n=1 Tax=Enterococcus TaxID=1350 RepID=UPI001E485957|nr:MULTISPECIES: 3D domain-containing protein [Enterococcus]MCD1023333.1 LysM peptidoglycan-binding domain-containing protein [Enterococcus sp. SMC-9]MDT2738789.1 3D domain-containing protein [Enterococcus canintestini]WHA08156.1 3D domain-containing protein [Enterococcus montenegrensis]
MKLVKSLFATTAILAGVAAFGVNANAAEVEHTVTSSDTLTSISLKYYGDTDHVQAIATANKITNVDLIIDGQVLKFDTDKDVTTSSDTTAAPANQTTSQEESSAATTNTAYSGRTITMESTAYSSDPADALGGGTVTATGQNLLENPMAVAVDPSVIPLGTHLYVEGYGEAYAVDTGSAIQGNIIDVHFPTAAQCDVWGRRQVQVTILDN